MSPVLRQTAIFISFIISSSLAFAQESNELDSLYAELEKAQPSDSIVLISRISQILPRDSSSYGLDLARKGMSLTNKLDLNKQQEFFFYQGLFYERLNNLDSALSSYLASREIALINKDLLFSSQSLLGLGVVNQQIGNFDRAIQYLDSLISETAQIDEKSVVFQVYLRGLDLLGDNYYSKGDYDLALIKYEQILQKVTESNFPIIMANAYKSISTVKRRVGDIDASLEYGHKALLLFENRNDLSQTAKTLNELGMVYSDLREIDKAIELYQRSIDVKEIIGDRQGIATTLLNMGVAYKRQKNFGLALEAYEKSKTIKEDLGIQRGMSALSINIGLIHKNLGEYDKAEKYYFEANSLAKAMGDKENFQTAYSNLCSLYLSWGKFEEAEKYGLLAVEAAKVTQSYSSLYIAYYNLSDAYRAQGDYKNAYDNFALTMSYKDSLDQRRNASKIARIEQEYQKESEKRKIELQSNQLALLTAQQRLEDNQKWAVAIISLLIVLVSFLGFRKFLKKSNEEKTKLKEQRDYIDLKARLTSKELAHERLMNEHSVLKLSVLSKEIAEKNERLNQLEDDLEKLTKDYIAEEAREHKGLAETVLSHGKNGEDWSRFMEYFQNVYHDYLQRLKQEFPEITPNELRLSALIKINLSSKEIANALNITNESLRTAKYRLRKKLKIVNDEKLTDFLLRY